MNSVLDMYDNGIINVSDITIGNLAVAAADLHVHNPSVLPLAESKILLTTGNLGALITDGLLIKITDNLAAGTDTVEIYNNEPGLLKLGVNGAENFKIDNNGYVGINTAASPTTIETELHVEGDINATTYYYTDRLNRSHPVGPSDFSARDPETDDIQIIAEYVLIQGYPITVVAPVYVPDGGTITNAICHGIDTNRCMGTLQEERPPMEQQVTY